MRTAALMQRLVWPVMAVVLSMPVVVWALSAGNPWNYISHTVPPGQGLYVVAKLAGLLALSLLWLQCLLALARHSPALKGFPSADADLHSRLGIATLVLVLLHVGLFVSATTLRKKALAIDLLLPNFTHGHYFLFVGLGAIAFWILLLAVFAGWRTSRGHHRWKRLHMLWPVAFGLIFAHAYAVGSESRYGAMRYVSLFIITSVGIAIVSRLSVVWNRRRVRAEKASSSPTAQET